jgi:hypothetical protein
MRGCPFHGREYNTPEMGPKRLFGGIILLTFFTYRIYFVVCNSQGTFVNQ